MWATSLIERFSSAGPSALPVLLDAAAKGLAVLMLAGLATLALHRASAAARHLVWFLAIVGLLLMPLLSAGLPGWHVLPRMAWLEPAVAPAPVAAQRPAETMARPDERAPRLVTVPPAFNPPIRPSAPPVMPTFQAVELPAAPTPPPPPLAPVTPRPTLTLAGWIVLAWLAGVGWLLGRMGLAYASLWWIGRHSQRITDRTWAALLRQLCAQLGIRRRVELLGSGRRAMPMTWGLWRVRVLLPADATTWPAEQRRAVLLHELAHARRRDCLTQLITRLACALHWFDPLAWLAGRRMAAERERACDDLVLSSGTAAPDYAQQLLHIVAGTRRVPFSAAAIAMARPSKLEGRVRAILDSSSNRKALTWAAVAIAGLLLLAVTLPLAMVRAQDGAATHETNGAGTGPATQRAPDRAPPLTARIVVERANGAYHVTLELTNTTDAPIGICTRSMEWRSRQGDGSWYASDFRPDVWHSDTPSPEQLQPFVVQVAPGKSLSLDMPHVAEAMKPGAAFKVEASYSLGTEYGKAMGIWGGSVKAPSVLIRVAADGTPTIIPAGLGRGPDVAAPASRPAKGGLTIGTEHFGDLRTAAYPADDAKPGLCAIGLYARTRMPPLPALFDWAITGRVARGANELIGRLPGESTPIRIMQATREGNEFRVLVALSPKKPEGSNYIWGELPQDLPAGRYHVVLTGAEYEERDGELVPAPKTDIRAFYQMECYFVVGGTPRDDAAWQAEGEAVGKTWRRLADRLKFLQTDFPTNQPGDHPELFMDMQKTAAGEVTLGSIQFQCNWDMGVPRKPPAPGTSGLAVFVNAYRHDDVYSRPDDYSLVNGPVAWDGKAERRRYAFDKAEFGWRVSVTVEGNRPEIVKKVNDVIDAELTGLTALLAHGGPGRPDPAAAGNGGEPADRRPVAWAELAGLGRHGKTDAEVQEQLDKVLPELKFDKVAFSAIVDSLRKTSDAEIWVDWKVLEPAGISKDAPVSIRLRDVKFSKALRVILDDLGKGHAKLGYAISEGVIVISTADDLKKSSLLTKAYDLRDLLVFPPDDPAPAVWTPAGEKPAPPATAPSPDPKVVRDLIHLIEDTVDPDSWQPKSAIGSIKELSGQFIITQAADNHKQIEALLNQLRQERAVQVTIQGTFYTVPARHNADFAAWIGFSTKPGDLGQFIEDGAAFKRKVADFPHLGDVSTVTPPRLTLFNGQRTGTVVAEDSHALPLPELGQQRKVDMKFHDILWDVQGTVSADRKSVTVSFRPTITKLAAAGEVPLIDQAAVSTVVTIPSDGMLLMRAPLARQKVTGVRADKAGRYEAVTEVVQPQPEPDWVYLWIKLTALINGELPATEPASRPATTPAAERYFNTNSIGGELLNEKEPVPIDAARAERMFVADGAHLSGDWETLLPRAGIRAAAGARGLPDDPKFTAMLQPPKSREPYAHVAGFSDQHLLIRISRPGGSYLWHHYEDNLATLRVPRSAALDSAFDLPSLETSWANEYRGLRQGDSVEQVKQTLGAPERTETTQAMSYVRLYYASGTVVIHIWAGLIQRIVVTPAPATQAADPAPINTDTELDAVVRQLQDPPARLGALRRLIGCGRFKLYQVGSAFFQEANPEQDRRAKRAAEAARAAADVPTITAALDAKEFELCFYGVWFFRSLTPAQQQELLPRIKELAATTTADATIRAQCVQILAQHGGFADFLAKRVGEDPDLSVVMHLVYGDNGANYQPAMNGAASRLLHDGDPAVRLRALSFIAATPHMAPMWQVRYNAVVFSGILELTAKTDVGLRSTAAAALASAEAADPAAARGALLRLSADPEPEVRRNAIYGLRAHRADPDVQAAIQKCLKDPVPGVVQFAAMADGVERHRAEMEMLSKCADPQVAQFAQGWMDEWNKHPASAPAPEPASRPASAPATPHAAGNEPHWDPAFSRSATVEAHATPVFDGGGILRQQLWPTLMREIAARAKEQLPDCEVKEDRWSDQQPPYRLRVLYHAREQEVVRPASKAGGVVTRQEVGPEPDGLVLAVWFEEGIGQARRPQTLDTPPWRTFLGDIHLTHPDLYLNVNVSYGPNTDRQKLAALVTPLAWLDTAVKAGNGPATGPATQSLNRDPDAAIRRILPPGLVVQKVVENTHPSYLEEGRGRAIFIGLPPEVLATRPHKQEETLVVYIMPPDYEGRDPNPGAERQTNPARKVATLRDATIFMWPGDGGDLGRKVLAALLADGPATMGTQPATKLTPELEQERDRLLLAADQKLRDGLRELAKTHPQLAIGNNAPLDKALDSQHVEPGSLSWWLGRSTKPQKAPWQAESIAVEQSWNLMVLVQPARKPDRPVAMSMQLLYPHLDLEGQRQAAADDPKLDAALKKLLADALVPLADLEQMAARGGAATAPARQDVKILDWIELCDQDDQPPGLYVGLPVGHPPARWVYEQAVKARQSGAEPTEKPFYQLVGRLKDVYTTRGTLEVGEQFAEGDTITIELRYVNEDRDMAKSPMVQVQGRKLAKSLYLWAQSMPKLPPGTYRVNVFLSEYTRQDGKLLAVRDGAFHSERLSCAFTLPLAPTSAPATAPNSG